MEEIVFQWFDYALKNGGKPAILKDKINYEVMGANEWRHAPSLKTMQSNTLTFYLSDRKSGESHLLTSQKPRKLSFLRQTVDFADRQSQNSWFTPVIINDSLNASNGLTFMTEPLNESITISGSFFGQMNASINKRDMDISVVLYELTPNGKYFYLKQYIGRASYAKNKSKRQLLQPGKKESIPFDDTFVVSKQITKGSRLVIVLNVNKNALEIINYGTGKDVNDETINDAKEPLQIKWYNDSYIKVPISK